MAVVTSAAIMCNFYPQFITKVTRAGLEIVRILKSYIQQGCRKGLYAGSLLRFILFPL